VEAPKSDLAASKDSILPGPTKPPRRRPNQAPADEAVDENGEVPIQWAKLRESIDESVYDKIVALGINGVYGNRNTGAFIRRVRSRRI